MLILKILYEIIICFIAGIEAGLGTGLVGLSAVISPMLITFLDVPAYEIALASDVLVSAIFSYTY